MRMWAVADLRETRRTGAFTEVGRVIGNIVKMEFVTLLCHWQILWKSDVEMSYGRWGTHKREE